MNAANATAGGDKIEFDATVFATAQTIQLGNTLPDISDDVTIIGPGANLLTVQGTVAIDIFYVSSSKSASFSGLAMNNGFAGILNDGTVTVTNSTFSGNSSGVENTGTAMVTNSTSSGNNVGIANYGTATVTNSTLSGNTTYGIFNNGGTATVTNSTFSGNDAGINIDVGTATVTNCTLSGNSFGISNFDTATLKNTICVGNTTNIDGTFTDGGNNITTGTAADAGLDPNGLQDNGGPTKTIALISGSPAINAGTSTGAPSTDQRGIARPQYGAVDIGAYEFNSATDSLVVTTTADEDNGTSDPAFGSGTSLREAINYANNKAGDDTITFDATAFASAQTITLGGTQLPNIMSNIAINGPTAGVTVSGNNISRVFAILTGHTASMDRLTVSNGISLTGGGIANLGTLALTNCTISGNTSNGSSASANGGGIFNNSTLTLTNCTISGNTATHGGGISNAGILTLTNCTLSGNTATGSSLADDGGGAILTYSAASAITLDSCTITNNSADSVAGGVRNGILLKLGTLSLRNSIVWGNGAGDIQQDGGTLTSNGYNLIGVSNAAASFTGTGDQTGVADAKLGTLADNGGPTQTHALLSGSSALNAGNTTQTTDQRGKARPNGGRADIGAVEADGLLINNVVVTEGDSGLQNVTFDVTLSAPASTPVTVDYATGITSSYPATPDVDFVSKTGSLSFATGESSKQITVQVKGDTLYEGLERFAVNLSNASGALLIDGEGSVNIQDDDSASTLRISDVTQVEGNSGTTDFVFTVSLTTPSSKTVSVTAAMGTTSTNAATANVDYVPLTPTNLIFAPGETSKTVTVAVNGDLLNENNERFSVKLSGAVNAPISDSEGVGTITNDDVLPTLRINDVSLSEGSSGTTAFTFTVSLSAASGKTVTVKYATASASVAAATANVDYVAVPLTTLTFLPGETSKQITVLVNGDTVVESNERFGVRLSNAVNAAIADSEGLGLILNDDVATLLLAPSPFEDYAPSE